MKTEGACQLSFLTTHNLTSPLSPTLLDKQGNLAMDVLMLKKSKQSKREAGESHMLQQLQERAEQHADEMSSTKKHPASRQHLEHIGPQLHARVLEQLLKQQGVGGACVAVLDLAQVSGESGDKKRSSEGSSSSSGEKKKRRQS